MISRQWRGLAKPDLAESYVQHLRTETFPAISRLPGFVSASIHLRVIPGGIEFLIVTQWASLESIRGFAGLEGDLCGLIVTFESDPLPDRLRLVPDQPTER